MTPANHKMKDGSSSYHDDMEDLPTAPTEMTFSPKHRAPFALKHSLTPATLSTSTTSSLPSPIDTMNLSESGMSYESMETNVWVPAPSPCRPKLDPRYAARLAPEMVVTPRTPYAGTGMSEADLMPPPGIPRNTAAVFRPSPILTTPESYRPQRGWSSTTYYRNSAQENGASDRFIPSRATSQFNFDMWEARRFKGNNLPNTSPTADDGDDITNVNTANPTTVVGQSQQNLLSALLRSELLGQRENQSPTNALRYQSPRQAYQSGTFGEVNAALRVVNSFNLTPVGGAVSQRLVATPPKRKRRISKVPFKVLDAPALQDDFYLNLVDWSSQNVLAVGLASCVYLWSACTSKVTKLCDLNQEDDLVTSVSWAQRGTHLAVGTLRGHVQLWDTIACKKVRDMSGHHARVGTLAWSGPVLASGSRDRLVFLRDVRAVGDFTDRLNHHKQEVCGLKWSFDEPAFLASGGNDNHLHVIDGRNPTQPLHQFSEHSAAVKAIAWSPHQHGLLASGGGTADRCIRFWNSLSGTALSKVDTGSQVCNLAWSQNCNELVSTHGYSLNQIVVWKYPSMQKVTTLTGHTYRVLYLAMSPDGSTVVTGAGDETLRFWQVFPGPRTDGKERSGGLLFPNTPGSVLR